MITDCCFHRLADAAPQKGTEHPPAIYRCCYCGRPLEVAAQVRADPTHGPYAPRIVTYETPWRGDCPVRVIADAAPTLVASGGGARSYAASRNGEVSLGD